MKRCQCCALGGNGRPGCVAVVACMPLVLLACSVVRQCGPTSIAMLASPNLQYVSVQCGLFVCWGISSSCPWFCLVLHCYVANAERCGSACCGQLICVLLCCVSDPALGCNQHPAGRGLTHCATNVQALCLLQRLSGLSFDAALLCGKLRVV